MVSVTKISTGSFGKFAPSKVRWSLNKISPVKVVFPLYLTLTETAPATSRMMQSKLNMLTVFFQAIRSVQWRCLETIIER